jgi:hypothetical protein
MNPKKVAARQKAKNARKLDKAPITDLTMSARSQLIAADVLSLEATRMRMASATKGAFGTRNLRASGSTSNYMIGGATTSNLKLPKRTKPPRKPQAARSGRPPTRRLPPAQATRTPPAQHRQTTVRSHVEQRAPIPKLNEQPTYKLPMGKRPDIEPKAPASLTLPPPRTYYGGGR